MPGFYITLFIFIIVKKNKHFVSKTVWHEEPTYKSETSNKIYSIPHLDF